MEALIPVIAALVALAGTLAGLLVGYRKWKKEREATQHEEYRRDRQKSYKQLWDIVEGFNVKLRLEPVLSYRILEEYIQSINAFILMNAIYLDDDDGTIVKLYIRSLIHLKDTIDKSDSALAWRYYGSTALVPDFVTEAAENIGKAQDNVKLLRNELADKVRLVLGGRRGVHNSPLHRTPPDEVW